MNNNDIIQKVAAHLPIGERPLFHTYVESIKGAKTNTGFKGISYYSNTEMYRLKDGSSIFSDYQSLEDALTVAFKHNLNT